MPDRVVRAGIIRSDAVNSLSWPAEIFYRRLMSVVDDYGRYEAKGSLLRADLYPLKIDKVSAADVDKWKAECASAGLVSCYRVNDKEYLCIRNFNQRLRSMKSKHPAPPGEAQPETDPPSDDSHPPADVGHTSVIRPPETETETESETESETEREGESSGADAPDAPPPADQDKLVFDAFLVWAGKNAPSVLKMKEPFTKEQYARIRAKYPKEMVQDVLTSMHNKPTLVKEYTSANLTCQSWCNKRLKDNPSGKTSPAVKTTTADEIRAIRAQQAD